MDKKKYCRPQMEVCILNYSSRLLDNSNIQTTMRNDSATEDSY